ncbi:MAG: bifunctional tRNA (5-methylaminomethyl-2-thiouridine)(34)-methyltransferase MnmD/FAD-dependent 5-carboxymethylaminomethyl-2-thiouridine(34) oxidoreductase MnmC [Burkholderiales bacterium]|nr:bifunctional tRNA (5-methylaminomethyl-2-thiouridine)(34)-methyltransferase MnmD/FAD-dependent 5-carboxymethylaminomethyl-2-thiouridine(34) oxidoreductase MnmC [Burkholderiales bacterium]
MSNFAKVYWDNNVPISEEFGDRYFSDCGAIEETKYVFLEHNQLKERFNNLQTNEKFIIGETGFGSGLNFFTTCALWQEQQNIKSQLHYISFEKHPLKPNDLYKIISSIPEFNIFCDEFIPQYKLLFDGFHRIFIAKNIYLTLIIGDIEETITQVIHPIDAWFLDGFNPNKNIAMWSDKTISQIARLSSHKTTFATFTANSNVRKTLIKNGFNVYKDKGFGIKREMLFGNFSGTLQTKYEKPYYAISHNNIVKDIAIIGAGISGATTAYALAKRGYKVTVYERNSMPASEASGNYQAMLYGSWSSFDGELTKLSKSCYRYAHYLITYLLEKDSEYQECGIVQLAHNKQQAKRNVQLISDNKLEELVSIDTHYEKNTVKLSSGLWLHPPALVNKLLSHPNIKLICDTEIVQTNLIAENKWMLLTQNNINFTHDALVICNSFMLNQFEQTKNIDIRKIRGQITEVRGDNQLNTVLCGSGYITPPLNNKYTLGATFDFENISTNVTEKDNLENIAKLSEILPEIAKNIDLSTINGRANIRVSTYDYLPIVGPISDETWFKATYNHISKDKNFRFNNECKYLPNLYIHTSHGSKGMMSAPICGELIADYIDNSPLAIIETLRTMMHPNRLWVRDLIRNS